MRSYSRYASSKYVSNLSKKKFKSIINSDELKEKIEKIRTTTDNEIRRWLKTKLQAFYPQGWFDEELYKQYTQRCKQANIPFEERIKKRSKAFFRPTGLFMVDFDPVEERSRELYRKFIDSMKREEIDIIHHLAWAHRTPSGKGLRLIMRRRPGHTLSEDQQWISRIMDEEIDSCYSDITRLSYLTARKDSFYLNYDLLFDPTLGDGFTNEELWDGQLPKATRHRRNASQEDAYAHLSFLSMVHNNDYWQRTPIQSIDEEGLIAALVAHIEAYRKEPIREGNRHNSYLLMATHLAVYLGDSDLIEKLLMKASLTYGHQLPHQEIAKIVQSAMRESIRKKRMFIPYYLRKFVNEGTYYVCQRA